jgi:regulator of sigma E protease
MELPTTPEGWAYLIGVGGLGFLFVITLVVFVHELGHFLAARFFGVRVESFSIGFGRAIVGFHDRHGTYWKIGWLPLGGYVKFWGDEGVSSTPDHEKLDHASKADLAGSFHHKALYQKAIIAVAGPIANFILAIVILTGLYFIYGVSLTAPQIGRLVTGAPAEAAGIRLGDVVLSIDGRKIRDFQQMSEIVSVSYGRPLKFLVRRGGEEIEIVVMPRSIGKNDVFGNDIRDTGIGVGQVVPGELSEVQPGSPAAAAGLKVGDIITRLDKKPVDSFADVVAALRGAEGKAVVVRYRRELRDEKLKRRTWKGHETKLTPNRVDDSTSGIEATALQAAGIRSPLPEASNPEILVTLGPVEAVGRAANTIRFIVVKTLDFIGQLLTGTGDYQQLSGPIGIASVSGQVLVFFGVVALINLAAVLSVSIGLLNLFPIPMLDGGHLLYYGIEAIRGRPLGERAQELGFRIGLAFVVGLMLFATWNDLVKFRLF